MIPFEDLTQIFRSLWQFLSEMPNLLLYERSVHNRSIVRAIGTILPLSPAPRIYFNLAAWSPELDRFTNERGCEVVSPKQEVSIVNDTLSESCSCHNQIEDLQKELDHIKEKLASLLANENVIQPSKILALEPKDTGGLPAPPPPPPPPLPEFNFTPSKPPVFKRSRKHVPRYGSEQPDSLHLVISQLAKEKPKLRHVERSPGGRPIKPKREPKIDPSDVLTLVLRKRFSVIQDSSDTDSYNTSVEITSPVKSHLVC